MEILRHIWCYLVLFGFLVPAVSFLLFSEMVFSAIKYYHKSRCRCGAWEIFKSTNNSQNVICDDEDEICYDDADNDIGYIATGGMPSHNTANHSTTQGHDYGVSVVDPIATINPHNKHEKS